MINLSPHFTTDEAKCPCCGLTVPWLTNAKKVAIKLEALRALAGNKPIIITSWIRCEKHNSELKPPGAPNSYHLKGLAVDFTIAGFTEAQMAAMAQKVGFGGIGLYPGEDRIHADLGPVRRW